MFTVISAVGQLQNRLERLEGHGEEVTSDALRHTFLVHLVRRGARTV